MNDERKYSIKRMTATKHDKSYNDCHPIYKLKLGLLE
jgi:hypothetical protein